MSEENELTTLSAPTFSMTMTVSEVLQAIRLVVSMMKNVLRGPKYENGKEIEAGVHYGTIPGCGDKPVLYQAGAQKLGMLFNFAPRFDIKVENFKAGHREYDVRCLLTQRHTDRFIAEGVGSCSTLESKYRFRWENTKEKVPSAYWDTRDLALLGGPTFVARKAYVDQKQGWYIFQKIEHDNPADYYNTCLKIAKKRAYLDAILSATAASDIFAPDDETPDEFMAGNTYEAARENQDRGERATQGRTVEQPRARSESNGNGHANGASHSNDKPAAERNTAPISDGNLRVIRATMQRAAMNDRDLEAKFGPLDGLQQWQMQEVMAWIKERAAANE
ncbi:MAG: hypothetical protein HY749_16065 [Gammaproteobacteria bacterium]|nr:hypothetical protein [Gammaproteobacteria bacterium]